MGVYLIHDNGGRPFKVDITENINENKVKIYKRLPDNDDYLYEAEPCLEYTPERIFIGMSPLSEKTRFSGGHGPRFDGNSILLHIKDNEYVSIGCDIYGFTTDHRITRYFSDVGGSDVPYPYAIDDHNNIYLLIEDVILSNVPEEHFDDPYSYYYKRGLITEDMGCIPPQVPDLLHFQGIKTYYHGEGKRYTFRYTPTPDSNYDRLSKFDDFGIGIIIEYIDGEIRKMSKESYIKLMQDFGFLMGFTPIENKVIILPRTW
jgi:hypothetical protein